MGLKSLIYSAALLASLQGVNANVLKDGTKKVATYWGELDPEDSKVDGLELKYSRWDR